METKDIFLTNIKEIFFNRNIYNIFLENKGDLTNFNKTIETDLLQIKPETFNITYSINYINTTLSLFQTPFIKITDDFNFKNFSIYEIDEIYRRVYNEILKKLNLNLIKIDINIVKDETFYQLKTILDYLNKKKETASEDLDINKELIDYYLEDFYNVPISSINIINYIYFLQKFPFYKLLINNHFKNTDFLYYQNLKEKNLLFDEEKIFFFPELFNLENNNFYIVNVLNLIENKINTLEYFFVLPSIKINKDQIKNEYNNDAIQEALRSYENINSDQKTRITIFYKSFNGIPSDNKLLAILLHLNKIEIDKIEIFTEEELKVLLSKALIQLYFVAYFYNFTTQKEDDYELLPEEKIESLLKIGIEKNIEINEYIILAFILYYRTHIPNRISNFIEKFKHLLFINNYFNQINTHLYPIFIFFCFSNEKIKIIKQYTYKENYLLDYFIELYNKLFKNTINIII